MIQKVVTGAEILSGLFVIVTVFSKMFLDENKKVKRVTRVGKFRLSDKVNSRGTIY